MPDPVTGTRSCEPFATDDYVVRRGTILAASDRPVVEHPNYVVPVAPTSELRVAMAEAALLVER